MTYEKLDLQSPDGVQGNVEKIRELFPNVVTEGPDGLAVDFDALRQELSDTIVEGPQERYRLDWPGKRAAMLAANTPISKTLRPVREESVNFDTTQNLFIEGDNLDALKLLQDSYLGKVKMIYIDPPYNTGKDFIYKDNFIQDKGEYLEESGQIDEDGGRLVANPDSNGRFHSDWLSMMYPRLKLARNLLRDDGVIFISIDDGEKANLRQIGESIFGGQSFVANLIWQKRVSPANDAKWYSSDHEYIAVFAKSMDNWFPKRSQRTEKHNKYYTNTDDDPRGPWNSAAYTCNKNNIERPNLYYPILNPFTGEEVLPSKNAVWAYSKETHKTHVEQNILYWGKDGESKSPRKKQFLTEAKLVVPRSILPHSEVGSTQSATLEMRELFDGESFSYPKSKKLIQKLIYQGSSDGDIILDFFVGSGTTVEAAFMQNNLDNFKRRYIVVQLPEKTRNKSAEFEAGYKTIADLSKERIRRAGAKILEDNPDQMGKLDVGFRVLKIDSSNMKDIHADPRELKQGELLDSVSHIKPDRSGEDLLFQVMLNQGIELSQSITRETAEGKTVYSVGKDNLAACFDDNISDELVKNIANRKPLYAIFRDESFKEPADKINAAQIFKQLTEGHTRMKVI